MSVRMFIHGLESSNQGTKAVYFRQKYPDMIIPTFTGDLKVRMAKLNRILSGKSVIRLVGSSFGGLMATLFAMEEESRVERMILLAPALNLVESELPSGKRISIPVWIYHGRGDQVIRLDHIEPVARRLFENLSFQVVDDDHVLHKTFKAISWDALLG